MKTTARVVVIGGGVMGCSALYHLVRLGWSDAVLVEKNELTAGSTWHAAGLCTHFAHNLTVMQLRAHSVKLYRELLPQAGHPTGFHATGALRITRDPDRLDEFRHVRGLGEFAGVEFQILTPDELKALYPLAQTDGLLGAFYEPADGYVDPSQATHAFAKCARDGGGTIYRHTAVQAIHRARGEWIVRTQNGEIRAEHIVNAAGTWCREVGAMIGVDLPVTPMLHQYIVTDRIAEFAGLPRELPFIRDPDESWYLRQERDGVVIGVYEKDGRAWAVDGVPAAFGMELLPPDLARIEAIAGKAMARVPAVAGGGVKEIVHGPITFTPDANPLIGPAGDAPNAWLLTGSSMGVMEGGGAGKFLAEWMDGGEPPMDALAVDARRFGDYADRAYRLDKAAECFAAQFAIHYPYEERPAARRRRLTPVYGRLKKLGAVFGCVNGWERPNWFVGGGHGDGVGHGDGAAGHGDNGDDHSDTDAGHGDAAAPLTFRRPGWFDAVGEECRNTARNVGIADLSAFAKFAVTGDGAAAFLDTLGANRAPTDDGGIVLTHALTPSGGVHSEFAVTRINGERFYLTAAAAAERLDEALLRDRAAGHDKVLINNVTRARCVLAVMGRRAPALLARLCDADLSQAGFPWLTAQSLTVAGVPVTALRVSYIGENGFELHCDADRQAALFDQLMRAGRDLGVGLFGAFAMNAMRLEKGYRAWGAEFTTERTLLEAGGGRFAALDDGREFTGKAAMLRRRGEPGHWQMHLLELDADADPFHTHAVSADGEVVGLVTSAAFGHRVNKTLALAYFRAPPAGRLSVSVLGKATPARVLDAAPYDLHYRRCRA